MYPMVLYLITNLPVLTFTSLNINLIWPAFPEIKYLPKFRWIDGHRVELPCAPGLHGDGPHCKAFVVHSLTPYTIGKYDYADQSIDRGLLFPRDIQMNIGDILPQVH